MNFTGRFIGGLRIDMESRRIELTIQSDRDDIGSEWDRLRKNEKLVFSVKPYKKNAVWSGNAYYWTAPLQNWQKRYRSQNLICTT